ncbi:MAG: mucoidy inhibitor MuiA family protein [Lentimicrobium sp.]|nr:mucoidy inhibitor MuiA family protein [Lentimicrobium sp.]
MKKIILLLSLFAALNGSGQSTDTLRPRSVITDATVFYSGAQISRSATIKLKPGKSLLIFDKLPYELNANSIQVGGLTNSKILSVKHQAEVPSSSVKGKEEKEIEATIKFHEENIRNIKTRLSVFDIEEKVLLDNSMLGSSETVKSVAEIKLAADFYRQRFNEIRLEKLKLSGDIETESNSLKELYIKLNRISSEKQKAQSKIMVLVESEKDVSSKLSLSYYIPSAGWTPFYDFRVRDISNPLSVVYNANVFQSSGEDWTNIKIKLSTSNPALSGEIPQLDAWYLGRTNYNQKPDEQNSNDGALKGRILDKTTKEPIPFVTITLESNNRQIAGTTSDFEGNYTIKPVASGRYDLKASFVGYKPVMVSNIVISSGKTTFNDIYLEETVINIESLEVADYKVPLISKDGTLVGRSEAPDRTGMVATRVGGVSTSKTHNYKPSREVVTNDLISNTLRTEIANLEYTIEIPYSVPSDGQDYAIRIKESAIPVDYIYHAIPKLSGDVFLTAELTNWNELNLLPGKAGIYYQGTFVGETQLNTDFSGDTLSISLGRDKSIFISREGDKEKFDKKIIGNNIREVAGWKITVKNNKSIPVKMLVQDQYPLSERKSVLIEQLGAPDAKVNSYNGKITWTLDLQAGEKKELNFSYSVKYPKYEDITLD